jgi:hypothetical protein
MVKLQEFAAGKADIVAIKLFSILSRRTGVKFTVKNSLVPYHNRWGRFVGKLAFTDTGKCFRLNFLQGSSDEVVSLDYWAKGKSPYKVPPNYVMSFEGWGISKIILQIEEFVKGNFKFEESISNLDEDFRITEETVKEVFGLYAAENPGIIAVIAKGGFDNSDMFAKIKTYMAAKQIKSPPGFATGTLASTINSYLKAVAKGKISSSIPPSQAAAAAKQIPVAEIVVGTTEGPSNQDDKDSTLYDILNPALAAKVNGLISEVNSQEGAFGIIRAFETQLKIASLRNTGARLVVACGRAGTGKTHTLKNYLQFAEGMGYMLGSGYIEAQGLNFEGVDDVTSFFCLNKDIPFILFDDADQLFNTRSQDMQNLLKHILDPDRINRVVEVPKKLSTKVGDVPADTYTVDSKLVWCTNLNPNQLNAAVADRMAKPANVFNFTDKEIMGIIEGNLSGVADEHPGLTMDEIMEVFMFFQSVVNRLAQKPGYDVTSNRNISFRSFTLVLDEMETYKLSGLNVGEVWNRLANTFGIKVEKPAKVIADA